MSVPESRILTVKELLWESLTIPEYQRPYKWTGKHVNQLFSDIATHKDKSSYRLGTIVFHQDKDETVNIVDGQQRTITLLLTVRALSKLRKKNRNREDLKNDLSLLRNRINPSFTSKISKANIRSNYLKIWRIVNRSDFTEEHIHFLLHKCEVVTFTLTDISEAFQFFDSQNARGRDLEPHDLLKAYHLREFGPANERLKATTVAKWENSDTTELARLFSHYLYRIRNWSKGASARYFGKEDTGLFKGVNPEAAERYPYAEQLRIAHCFVDHYNQQYESKIDGHNLGFPFYLDQTIINGRRFFEMISHYQEMTAQYRNSTEGGCPKAPQLMETGKLDGYAKSILDALNNYDGRNRTGDKYVRTIFDCLLICYIDKFGLVEVSRAIEKSFIWAYSLRLQQSRVLLASMDNHVVMGKNLFKLIKDAIRPSDFINTPLSNISLDSIQVKHLDRLAALFKIMKYGEGEAFQTKAVESMIEKIKNELKK